MDVMDVVREKERGPHLRTMGACRPPPPPVRFSPSALTAFRRFFGFTAPSSPSSSSSPEETTSSRLLRLPAPPARAALALDLACAFPARLARPSPPASNSACRRRAIASSDSAGAGARGLGARASGWYGEVGAARAGEEAGGGVGRRAGLTSVSATGAGASACAGSSSR